MTCSARYDPLSLTATESQSTSTPQARRASSSSFNFLSTSGPPMKSNSQNGNFPGGNSSRDDKHWVNAVQRVRVALWSSYRDTSASPHLSMNRHAVWQCGALSTNQQQIVDRRQRGRKIHLQHIKNADHDDILTACMMLSATLWIYAEMGVCYSLPDLEVASACVRMVATSQISNGDASRPQALHR